MELTQQFIEKLGREFRTRRERNTAYSLRSFSRDIAVNSGRLSQYFSGRRPVTPKAAFQIMERLGLSPNEQVEWLGLAGKDSTEAAEPALLDQKVFELIADPLHFTLLSLIETKNFQQNPRWIAKRLSSSVPEVAASLKLLSELGLTKEKAGKLVPTHKDGLRSSDGVKNSALRKAHEKQLAEAIQAIERVPLSLRDITSITMPTDPAKLELAKQMIKDFRRKISTLLAGEAPSEVYRLQIQLIPRTDFRGD